MEKSILIIDDDDAVRGVIAEFLDMEGYTVSEAPNALVGIEKIGQIQPQVVFLDMVMPDLNGIEALKKIKQKYPDQMVIVMSGLAEDAMAKEAINLGAYDYLTKPVSLAKLKEDFLDRIFAEE